MKIDAVHEIKSRLSMQEVLTRYGVPVKRRMKCPLHDGDGLNFDIKEKTWTCYSRCGRGDAISFVQKFFDLSFMDAVKKIDQDFGLGIFQKRSFEDLRKMHYEGMKRQAEKRRIAYEKESAESEYWKVFEEWKRLDENKRKFAPKTQDEEWHPLFVEALQKIAYQEYLLDCAEARRCSGD